MTDMETTLEDQTTDDAADPVTEPAPEPTEPETEQPPIGRPGGSAVVKYDDRDREVIARVIGRGQLDEVEVDFVQAQAERLGLDIMTKQMHVWKDHDGQVILMVGIDGLRLVAVRTGRYRGRTDPEWLHPEHGWVDAWAGYDDPPLAARVRVLHADYPQPMTGIAVYAEAVQTRWDKKLSRRVPNKKWSTQPAHMLAKVAEAMALRAAFPAELAGVYTDDEIGRADAMLNDVGDPVNEPGADDELILSLEKRLKTLPPEYRAKLEGWWADKYAPSIPGMGEVRPLHDGGLRRFTRDSEHITYWADMIGKAEAKYQADSESEVADNEPADDQPTDTPSEQPAAAERQTAAPAAPTADSAPDPETGLTDLEAGVIDSLEAIGSGRAVDIAQHMGYQSPNGALRTVIAALFERDMIELDPDAEQGRGPLRVYRRNEQLLADMATHYQNNDNETETES